MRYAEALAHVQHISGSARAIDLLANVELRQFSTFLRAYGALDGFDYQITASVHQGLINGLDALAEARSSQAAIVVVLLEDIFPELGLRSGYRWSEKAIRDILATADDRVTEFADWLANKLRRVGLRSLVVPPCLGSPPIWSLPSGGHTPVSLLSLQVQIELGRHGRGGDILVADPAVVFSRLRGEELRSDALFLASGNPFSLNALDALARWAHGELADSPVGRKLLITDLDNTLWRGVLGEDGPHNVAAHPDSSGLIHSVYQNFLHLLRSEGVLLAACSKADTQPVLAFLRNGELLTRAGISLGYEDFVVISCSWHPKSIQIKSLCRQLGLLPSAAVFIDDDPVELAEVSEAIPEMATLAFPQPADLHAFLCRLRDLFFGGRASAEDQTRTALYAVRQRAEAERPHFGSLNGFLQSLQMKARFSVVDAPSFVRPLQLVNKTNQFNLTGKRFDAREWADYLGDSRHLCIEGRLADRFGDHSMVLVALLTKDGAHLTIENMVVSCRVLNRGLETAFLDWLVHQFRSDVTSLSARWRRTGKNEASRSYLSDHGFRLLDDDDGETWVADNFASFSTHYIGLE